MSATRTASRTAWLYPNIQKVYVVVDGTSKQMNVCTKCLKAGKVTRG